MSQRALQAAKNFNGWARSVRHDFSRVSMDLRPTQGHENGPEAFALEGPKDNSPGQAKRSPGLRPAESLSPVGATEMAAKILNGIANVFDRPASAQNGPGFYSLRKNGIGRARSVRARL